MVEQPMNLLTPALFVVLGFAAGALPFSVWIGRALLGRDIRTVGDANPGATNVFRAGGSSWRGAVAGLLAVLLDGLKAALPVGSAYALAQVRGWPLALVAVAPVLGHAFSPLLRGRGGKAVAATGGAWAGLTAWEGPTLLGLGLLLVTRVLRANGWAVVGAMTLLLIWLLATPPAWNSLWPRPTRGEMGLAWALQMAVLCWKHRADLLQPPQWRSRAAPP